MKIRPHRHFNDVRQRLAERPELLRAWRGIAYRVTSLDYPKPADILAGKGSYINGGRWNAMSSFRAVYGSTDDTVAVAESRATADYAGVTYPFITPRLLVAVELQLQKVLDLTSQNTRRILGLTLEDLRADDWRRRQEEGMESWTQAIGRAAFVAKADGLLVPSAKIQDGVNVAYFPDQAADGEARLFGMEQLEKFATRSK